MLYHMRARSYDPALQRFVSEDPIGLAGGINPYTSAGNDPVNYADPFGLCADLKITFTRDENNSWVRTEFCRDAGGLSTSVTIITDPLQELGLNVSSLTAPLSTVANGIGELSAGADGVRGLEGIASGDFVGGGLSLAMATPIGRSVRGARLLSAAIAKYPTKALRSEWHHAVPKYLGGDPNGRMKYINAAYHQQITNAFRELCPYGTGQRPSATQLDDILRQVYSRFPLP